MLTNFQLALAAAAVALFLCFVSSAFDLLFGMVGNRQNLVPPPFTHSTAEYEQHAVHMNTSAHGALTTATGFAQNSLTCS